MSKNFELMQEAGVSLGNSPIPELKPPARFRERNGSDLKNGCKSNADQESLKLVQNVFLSGADIPRVVVFAGIDSGNGCSEISARTGQTLAGLRLGSICLVDANFRSPILSDLLGVCSSYGLADSLLQPGPIRGFAKAIPNEDLWLLAAGSLTNGCPSLVSGDRIKARMAELRKEFDYVLVNSPPLNSYSDGMGLAQLADGLILVGEAGATRREVASDIAQNLRAARIRVLGAVLNKCKYPIPESLYRIL